MADELLISKGRTCSNSDKPQALSLALVCLDGTFYMAVGLPESVDMERAESTCDDPVVTIALFPYASFLVANTDDCVNLCSQLGMMRAPSPLSPPLS